MPAVWYRAPSSSTQTPPHWATALPQVCALQGSHAHTVSSPPTCLPSPRQHPGRPRCSPAPGRRPEPAASNQAWSGRGGLAPLLFPAPRRSAFKASPRCSRESATSRPVTSRQLSAAALSDRKGAPEPLPALFSMHSGHQGHPPELEYRLRIVLPWIRVRVGKAGTD